MGEKSTCYALAAPLTAVAVVPRIGFNSGAAIDAPPDSSAYRTARCIHGYITGDNACCPKRPS
jgi:hypothetical protein